MFCCCAYTDPKANTVEAIAEEPPKTRDAPEEVKEEVVPEPQEEPVEANEPVEEKAPEPETNAVPEPEAPKQEEKVIDVVVVEPTAEQKQKSAIDELMASMADDIEQINKKAEG
mmetsp:Transcript_96542/g.170975  ORF Transcript_96542/g.170975 Transcript_96542/m.170975 type:complete len:114 (-) Transcript_96542:159-500(-)